MTGESINYPIGLFPGFPSSTYLKLAGYVFTIATYYAIHGHSINGSEIRKLEAENPDSTKHLSGRNQHPEAALCQSLWFHTGVHTSITQRVSDSFDRCHVDIQDGTRTRLAVQENIRQRILKGFMRQMRQIYTVNVLKASEKSDVIYFTD